MALHTYTKTEYKNAPDHKTTPLNATNLNHCEDGLADAYTDIKSIYDETGDLIAPRQETLTADKAYSIGDQFIYGGKLYKVTAAISSGGAITIGTNCDLADSVSGQVKNKINLSAIANNLTTSSEGYVLDARQGKALNDYVNKHTFGSAVNIKNYTSPAYTATSDGYLYLATIASGLIEVLINGLTVNVVAPSLGGAKNIIFIRKGMTIKYSRCYPTGNLGDMTANFYPLT